MKLFRGPLLLDAANNNASENQSEDLKVFFSKKKINEKIPQLSR